MKKPLLLSLLFSCSLLLSFAQKKNDLKIIAYYAGDSVQINKYPIEKLSHLIFSFGHLKGDSFHLNKKGDTILLQNMVALKARNPRMKVLLSLGGWGGCEKCSPVFSSAASRTTFANSVKKTLIDFNADGIDLDWEYPAITGFPGHAYMDADKDNFTALVKELRRVLGKTCTISFAAGGFVTYLQKSIDWKPVMDNVDFVNLMTYDLVSGFSTIAGHHTPLYSTTAFPESVDRAVRYLDSIHIPLKKVVIGAAFYARLFETKDTIDNGLNRSAAFKRGVSYKSFDTTLSIANGYHSYWDKEAQAPYSFNPATRLFATYDNERSIELKTQYALRKRLYGIMFWQLRDDKMADGLLDVMYKTANK